jgi:hypothetical protein
MAQPKSTAVFPCTTRSYTAAVRLEAPAPLELHGLRGDHLADDLEEPPQQPVLPGQPHPPQRVHEQVVAAEHAGRVSVEHARRLRPAPLLALVDDVVV